MAKLHLRTDDLEWRQVDEEVVVLDLKSGNYLTFNSTGGLLFQRLADGATTEDLVSALLDEYETTSDRAEEDVASFIDRLREENLIASAQDS